MGPSSLSPATHARCVRLPQIGRQRPRARARRQQINNSERGGCWLHASTPARAEASPARSGRTVRSPHPRAMSPSLIALRSCYKNERFGAHLTTVTCSWPRSAAHAHGAIVPQLISRRQRPPPSSHGVPPAVQRRLCYLQLLRLSARGPFPVGRVRYGGCAAGRLRVPVGRRRRRPGTGSCTWCVRDAAAAAAYAGRARRPGRGSKLQQSC